MRVSTSRILEFRARPACPRLNVGSLKEPVSTGSRSPGWLMMWEPGDILYQEATRLSPLSPRHGPLKCAPLFLGYGYSLAIVRNRYGPEIWYN